MPKTPRRASRDPIAGARFPSQVVAANVQHYRRDLRMLTQDDLSERMEALGHQAWVHRATVSEVERGGRSVTVDELFGLAAALEVSVLALLDPLRGEDLKLEEGRMVAVDVGMSRPLLSWVTRAFISGDPPGSVVAWAGNRRPAVMTPTDDLWEQSQLLAPEED